MHQAFLNAIQTEPDEDTHRLVYADWLEEFGDECDTARGQLIRLQCELEPLPAEDARRPDLERQIKTLLRKHRTVWTREVRKAKVGRGWTFRRGFLGELTISARDFVRMADTLFKVAPLLRAVRFPEASNEVHGLAACPALARLTEVDLTAMCMCGHCPIGRELAELFASPHVTQLRRLSLAGDRLEDAGATLLAEVGGLANLTHLNLRNNGLTTAGAEALAASPHLNRLVELDLRDNRLVNACAPALVNATFAGSVRLLDLRRNGIGKRVAEIIRSNFGERVRI